MLPTEGDKSPAPFHLSVNFKLVLAYVLGIHIMVSHLTDIFTPFTSSAVVNFCGVLQVWLQW